MFSRSEKPTISHQAPSLIAKDLTIVGNLSSEGEIQIDGHVDGDITTKSLTVGSAARVNGRIEAEKVVIKGHVNGLIRAKTVILATGANVVGDIIHEDLKIDSGAVLEGMCRREPVIAEEATASPLSKAKTAAVKAVKKAAPANEMSPPVKSAAAGE